MSSPEWPEDAWQGFIEMRKAIKAPMTPYAEKLARSKLEKAGEQGHDIRLVLEKSIFCNWKGLFPDEATKLAPTPTWKERGFSNVESFQAAQEQQAQAKADRLLGG